jgi:hypothetical protein
LVNNVNQLFERDFCLFIAKRIFSASPMLIYLLNLFRVPLKNTFDAFFSNFIENKMNDILNDEENIISVIQALQGKYFQMKMRIFIGIILDTIFPNDAKDRG